MALTPAPPPFLQLEKSLEEAALLRTLRQWHEAELSAKQEALLELRRARANESAEATTQVRCSGVARAALDVHRLARPSLSITVRRSCS